MYLLSTLVAVLWLSSEAFGKTVTGLFKSEEARQQKGQFITKFMYQGNCVCVLHYVCLCMCMNDF